MLTLVLPDGSRKEVPEGTRSCDVAEKIGKRMSPLKNGAYGQRAYRQHHERNRHDLRRLAPLDGAASRFSMGGRGSAGRRSGVAVTPIAAWSVGF